MIAELLICALALPSSHFSCPAIVSYHLTESDDEKHLIDWLKKHNDIDEVFIHPTPQEDRLKQNHWERLPFTINGKQIWIQRKPHSDQNKTWRSA